MPGLTLKKSNLLLGGLLVCLFLSSGLFLVTNQLNAPLETRSITSQDIIDALSGVDNPFLLKDFKPQFINHWSDEYYSNQVDEHGMVNKLHEDMDSYFRVVSLNASSRLT